MLDAKIIAFFFVALFGPVLYISKWNKNKVLIFT